MDDGTLVGGGPVPWRTDGQRLGARPARVRSDRSACAWGLCMGVAVDECPSSADRQALLQIWPRSAGGGANQSPTRDSRRLLCRAAAACARFLFPQHLPKIQSMHCQAYDRIPPHALRAERLRQTRERPLGPRAAACRATHSSARPAPSVCALRSGTHICAATLRTRTESNQALEAELAALQCATDPRRVSQPIAAAAAAIG